jgi:hypothetical protein
MTRRGEGAPYIEQESRLIALGMETRKRWNLSGKPKLSDVTT